MNKKTAKLLTFALLVGGATAIYLYFTKTQKEKPQKKDRPKSGGYVGGVIKVSTTLNIRKEPNITSAIVGKLKNGDKVTVGVLPDDDNWYKLIDNDSLKNIGYISKKYVEMPKVTTDGE